jgi:hypothetical protein
MKNRSRTEQQKTDISVWFQFGSVFGKKYPPLGEETRGGAATSLWAAMDGALRFLCCETRVRGGKRERSKGGERRPPHNVRWRLPSPSPTTAGHDALPATAVAHHERCGGGNELGFQGSRPGLGVLFCRDGWSTLDRDEWPGAADVRQA